MNNLSRFYFSRGSIIRIDDVEKFFLHIMKLCVKSIALKGENNKPGSDSARLYKIGCGSMLATERFVEMCDNGIPFSKN